MQETNIGLAKKQIARNMTKKSVSSALDKVNVRLPDGMRERLKRAASHNNRSVNAEIIARLETSFSGGGVLGPKHQEALAAASETLKKLTNNAVALRAALFAIDAQKGKASGEIEEKSWEELLSIWGKLPREPE